MQNKSPIKLISKIVLAGAGIFTIVGIAAAATPMSLSKIPSMVYQTPAIGKMKIKAPAERTCVDSDGGAIPAKAGSVTVRLSQTSSALTQLNDVCLSADKVLEYSCFENPATLWDPTIGYKAEVFTCENGFCSEGACKVPQ